VGMGEPFDLPGRSLVLFGLVESSPEPHRS
jgi:hypothetical protein